jgi:cytochrome c553
MRRISAPALLIFVLALATSACSQSDAVADTAPHVSGATPEEAGRYITTIGGCHDCHTPRFLETGWEVPESEWFTGVPVGWRGPWGTTYGSNLRLTVQRLTEDQFVETLKTRKALPPMPWPLVSNMHESDMRAVYKYLKSLGPAGEEMPAPLPPNQEPTTPFVVLAPPTMPN